MCTLSAREGGCSYVSPQKAAAPHQSELPPVPIGRLRLMGESQDYIHAMTLFVTRSAHPTLLAPLKPQTCRLPYPYVYVCQGTRFLPPCTVHVHLSRRLRRPSISPVCARQPAVTNACMPALGIAMRHHYCTAHQNHQSASSSWPAGNRIRARTGAGTFSPIRNDDIDTRQVCSTTPAGPRMHVTATPQTSRGATHCQSPWPVPKTDPRPAQRRRPTPDAHCPA